MRSSSSVVVVIPALDEEALIADIVARIPDWVDRTVVVDNGSKDRTSEFARAAGATVVAEPVRGYGRACLTGVAAAQDADILVFLDADGSSLPEQMDRLVEPIASGRADLVIGSRTRGDIERGAMTLPQRVGNVIAPTLIRWLWGARFTDLGPFRAIRAAALRELDMDDPNFGWTVQMQVRAARLGLRCCEVPVDFAQRSAGRSKISGTARGVLGASARILGCIVEERILPRVRGQRERERLAVFAKHPEAGFAKTRLIPCLGAQGAAELHARMVARTLQVVRQLTNRFPVDAEVWIAGGEPGRFAQRFGAGWVLREQPDGDLGARISCAFDALLASASRAVIVGTDCPDMSPAVLRRAFEVLRSHDVALGPATDGGYYLVGLRRPTPELFQGIRWGTSEVLAQTLDRARRAGLRVALLTPLDDVDRPDDLGVWLRADATELPVEAVPELSVIIPALDEAERIEASVAAVLRPGVEVVVADGGSTDGTPDRARASGAQVVDAARGRGPQLNAGAAVARAPRLLFLHADTGLPSNFDDLVRECLDRSDVTLGAFRFRLDRGGALLRCVEVAVALRCALFRTPRGDQALFLRASTFRALGGFAPITALEDVALVGRAKRLGRVVVLSAPAVTSARRWEVAGVLRTTLVNQACIAGFAVGIPADRLAAARTRWTRPATDGPSRHGRGAQVASASRGRRPELSSVDERRDGA